MSLRQSYGSNDRFYHTLSHIVDGLDQLLAFMKQLDDPEAFTLGWLFHDAVYDSRAHDNEEKSVDLLKQKAVVWGLSPDLIDRAARFILVTKHGDVLPATSDERYMVDLDLSILGKAEDAYVLYEKAVRREYGWLPDVTWREGRGKFLQGLASSRLFHTEFFSDRCERQAKANISMALKKLTVG